MRIEAEARLDSINDTSTFRHPSVTSDRLDLNRLIEFAELR